MYARILLSELRPSTLAALYVDTTGVYDSLLIRQELERNVGEEEAAAMIEQEKATKA